MKVEIHSKDDLQWLIRIVSKQLRFAKESRMFARESELLLSDSEITQCERILNSLTMTKYYDQ